VILQRQHKTAHKSLYGFFLHSLLISLLIYLFIYLFYFHIPNCPKATILVYVNYPKTHIIVNNDKFHFKKSTVPKNKNKIETLI